MLRTLWHPGASKDHSPETAKHPREVPPWVPMGSEALPSPPEKLMGFQEDWDAFFWGDAPYLFQGRCYVIVSFGGRVIFGAERRVEEVAGFFPHQVPSLLARNIQAVWCHWCPFSQPVKSWRSPEDGKTNESNFSIVTKIGLQTNRF